MEWLPDNWGLVWTVETPILELLVRGAVMYLGIMVLLRVMPRRTGGELTTTDLIVILLVTEAATHTFGVYSSVGDGLFLIATLLALDYAVNALTYRFGWFERLMAAPPLPLIENGRLLRRNMRREFVTEEELMGHLRTHGVGDLSRVKRAFVEGEGEITFVTREGGGGQDGKKTKEA